MKYKKGDRVRIVSDRTKNMNSNGCMDKYLGTVMTIKEAHKTVAFGISCYYRMVEDKCEWFWNDEMIAGLASEIPFDFGAWKDKNVCMHCRTREEAEVILKKWAAEHPAKTNRDKFAEVFGEIERFGKCEIIDCSTVPCLECNWWNREYVEPYKTKE